MTSSYLSPLWYPTSSFQQFQLKIGISILNLIFLVVVAITGLCLKPKQKEEEYKISLLSSQEVPVCSVRDSVTPLPHCEQQATLPHCGGPRTLPSRGRGQKEGGCLLPPFRSVLTPVQTPRLSSYRSSCSSLGSGKGGDRLVTTTNIYALQQTSLGTAQVVRSSCYCPTF